MKRVSVGDVQLNVTLRGSGRPLLLVHGFPLDHSMWQAQIDHLSDHNQIIAPDLRGFGASDVSEGTASMKQMADDLAALLVALNIDSPVTFCGLSMGGYVGWQFWKHHADQLDRLILCDTRAVPDTPEAAKGRQETANQVLADGPQKLTEAMLTKLFYQPNVESRPAIRDATQRVMESTNPKGIAAALRGMAEREDFSESLSEIQTPTLVICGQHDAISASSEMQGIAAAMPHASFVEIADAGHMTALEKPAEVNAAIREFLAG